MDQGPSVVWYVDVCGFFVEAREPGGAQLAAHRGGNVAPGSDEAVDPPDGAPDQLLALWARQSAILMAAQCGISRIERDWDTERDCLDARDEIYADVGDLPILDRGTLRIVN